MTDGGAPATPQVASTTVVLVAAAEGRGASAAVAPLPPLPEDTELVVVMNGRGAVARAGAVVKPGTRVVEIDRAVPFGTAAARGAALGTGRALCFLTEGTSATDGWLAPLVAAVDRPGVGAAVPGVATPGVVSAGAHHDRWPSGSTETAAAACVCVRRSAYLAAGGLDPAAADLASAAAELSRTLRAAALATVQEPASRVVSTVRTEPSAATAAPGDSILVVTRAVPGAGTALAERRAAQLVADLAAVVPDGKVTVLAVDGRGKGRAARPLLRGGVEVVAGPEDWDAWLRRRALRFSHVVVTDFPAHRRLDAVLRATQPQAHRVLALPSLPFADVAAASPPATLPDDAEGRRLVVDAVRSRVVRAAEAADAAWCATSADRDWMAANVPGLRCSVVPTAASGGEGPPFDRRTGYVVLATPGADLLAGHEDAARFAATEVIPRLVARDPRAVLRIVADEPSPGLQLMAGPNVEVVPADGDPARWFRRSRVCLAWYPRGGGAREALALALDTATPVVTSPDTLADLGLVDVPGAAAGGPAAALRAEELHDRRARWEEASYALRRVAAGPRSAAATRARLVRAAAAAGIAPVPGASPGEPLVPVVDGPPSAERPLRPTRVPIVGSAWKGAAPAEDGPVPELPPPAYQSDWTALPVNDQYRRWCARYGPTTTRLARLANRLAGLVRHPTISVVMPVFDTDPSWLDDAIASVRAQVYDHWELCVGDDGSSKRETLEVLQRHVAEEPRIRVVHLPGQSGIAAASNAALALATGDYVGFLDHDDELKPHALGEIALALDERPSLDLLYTDEDKREPDGRLVDPFFKPDWSPDHLMSRNYVCHLLVVRRSLLDKLGGFRLGYDGSQDYDLVLRATELTTEIAHVAEPLYTWRKVAGSTAAVGDAKPWALDAARRALADALERRGTPGEVLDGMLPTTYRVRYTLRGRPKVSIVIPTRDRVDLVRGCVESVVEHTTYADYELIVVDNQSTHPETLGWLARFPGPVVRYPHRFNYSRLMNLAAHEADGDLLVFLNNDTKVRTPDWLEALAEHAQRPEVGIVAPRLLYPNGHPQHEGTIVGYKGGHAGNVDHHGFWGMGDIVRNCSAVTGACLMIRPSVYWELGGLDERLRVAFNDVDLCLRARQAGYDVVYTPYAELFHIEGGTRGIHAHVEDDDEFEGHWVTHKCLDPFYSPNFERLYPFRIRG